jgi:hypothetical protein
MEGETVCCSNIKLLNPTDHYKYHQINNKKLHALTTLYLCVMTYLRRNSELWHLLHKLIGFYNRNEKCLQRGTAWVFKWGGLY